VDFGVQAAARAAKGLIFTRFLRLRRADGGIDYQVAHGDLLSVIQHGSYAETTRQIVI
jgi:hypothetical protein